MPTIEFKSKIVAERFDGSEDSLQCIRNISPTSITVIRCENNSDILDIRSRYSDKIRFLHLGSWFVVIDGQVNIYLPDRFAAKFNIIHSSVSV